MSAKKKLQNKQAEIKELRGKIVSLQAVIMKSFEEGYLACLKRKTSKLNYDPYKDLDFDWNHSKSHSRLLALSPGLTKTLKMVKSEANPGQLKKATLTPNKED